MTVSDKRKYDCTTCPYPRYKDGAMIFCDVCIRRILDEQKKKKRSDLERQGGFENGTQSKGNQSAW